MLFVLHNHPSSHTSPVYHQRRLHLHITNGGTTVGLYWIILLKDTISQYAQPALLMVDYRLHSIL